MHLLQNDTKNGTKKYKQTKKTNKKKQTNEAKIKVIFTKVSTTVFKALVFKTHALFVIFSDYGHICFWNNMLQLHTTACAVSSC